jgi:hypothetical protein
MIIPDKELEDEINTFLNRFRYKFKYNYSDDMDYIDYIGNQTFYIEFINYLVSRGLEITNKK